MSSQEEFYVNKPQEVEIMLQNVGMSAILFPAKAKPPQCPLSECLRTESRAAKKFPLSLSLSVASEQSMESILDMLPDVKPSELSNSKLGSSNEIEMRRLIYKLCRSLFKKAIQKTQGNYGSCSKKVAVDTKYETNMSHMSDWLPLLHLFEPNRYYEMLEKGSSPLVQSPLLGVELGSHTSAKTPSEALELFMDQLLVKKLSGGNSNHVYQLGHPQYPGKNILLRLYGNVDGDVIDRYRDVMAIRQMSNEKMSPLVLHFFRWGRVEEFMEHVATGSTDLLLHSPALLSRVFREMSEMHKLPVEPFLPQNANNVWFKNNGKLECLAGLEYKGPEDYLSKNVSILSQLLRNGACDEYYKSDTEFKVMEQTCPSSFERASLRYLRLMSASLREPYRRSFVKFACQEILLLRKVFQQNSIPLVFSHNDINPWNILISWKLVDAKFRMDGFISSDDDEVTSVVSTESNLFSRKFLTKKGRHKNLVDLRGLVFIDFEYTDVNYRSIDLGNTICELDYDYSCGNEEGGPGFIKYLYTFPPPAYESKWKNLPKEYPRVLDLIFDAWRCSTDPVDEQDRPKLWNAEPGSAYLDAFAVYYKHHGIISGDAKLSHKQIGEVFLGVLASHLYWSLWAFVMACNPDTLTNSAEENLFSRGSNGLDYVEYGNCRIKEYFSAKLWMKKHGFFD